MFFRKPWRNAVITRVAGTHTLYALLFLSTLAQMAPPSSLGAIINVFATSTGGTVSGLTIETDFNTNDAVVYSANFTSDSPINFSVTDDGPGNYFLGDPFSSLTNATGTTWPTFDIKLIGAPAGSTFLGAGWDMAVFAATTQAATNIDFHGGPGLSSGTTTNLYTEISISAVGTFDVTLTPPIVPEPSSFATCATAVAALLARRMRSR
jgi:hypothetical protein